MAKKASGKFSVFHLLIFLELTLGFSFSFVIYIFRPTDEHYWVGPSGAVVGVLMTLLVAAYLVGLNRRNVSIAAANAAHRQALEELGASEERFRALFDMATDGIAMIDIARKRFVDVNPKLCTMLGYSRREMTELKVEDIHREADLPYIFEDFAKHVRREVTLTEDVPVLRKDGTLFYADISGGPFLLGEQMYMIGIFREVTERRKAEQEQRESEARYRALFERTGTGMAIVEADGTLSLVNRTFAELAESEAEALTGRSFLEGVNAKERGQMQENHLRRVRGEAVPERYEFGFVTTKGHGGTALLTLSYLAETRQTVASVIDITERKRAEEALRENKQKLELILNTLPYGVQENDAEGRVTYSNPAHHRILAMEPGEIVGRYVWDYEVNETEKTKLRDYLAYLVAEQPVPEPYVTRNLTKDGRDIILEIVWDYRRNAAGEVTGFISIISDITDRKSAELELRQRERELSAIFEAIPLTLFVKEAKELRYVRFNRAGEKLVGQPREVLIGKNDYDFFPREDADVFTAHDREVLLTGEEMNIAEESIETPSGRRIVHTRKVAITDDEGTPLYLLGISEDITERKAEEARLRQSAAVFESTAEGILITDPDANIVAVNPAFTAIVGYLESEVLGKNPRVFRSGRYDEEFYQTMWSNITERGQWQGEIWNRRKNGEAFPVWETISAVRDLSGQIIHYVAVFSDISRIKKTEEQLLFLANHDPLTNLPNRLLLNERLDHALKVARREGETTAVLFLDLDHFKEINDSFGHAAGDTLLCEVAEIFRHQLREVDTVARVSGDEFVILLENTQIGNAAKIAKKLQDALGTPLSVGEHEVSVNTSIGIAMAPKDGDDAATLLKNADAALYRAKERGRNTFNFFSEDMAASSFERVFLHNALRKALEREEFLVYYQPQVDIESGGILGTEALVRWQQPEIGLVSPSQFIPLAEDTGLIEPLGEWVLREACRQMQQWRKASLPMRFVSVNLAGRQIVRHRIVDTVRRVLEESGLPPECLELEVTESTIMEEQDTLPVLEGLQSLGIRLSIDDFGTGHSSLARLKRMPINKLKIDQSFVRGIPQDSDDVEITRAVIALAKSLKMDVIAEGVETREQASLLLAEGCRKAQGYLYSPPVSPEQLEAWLQERL